jgi:two-component system NtrC family sensor kinase
MQQPPAGIRQTSIKTKVTLTTLVTVSIVLASVSYALFFYFHNTLRDSIYKQQFQMVSEIADQLDGRIQLARHQLTLAATEIDSQVLANPAKLERLLYHITPINMIFDAGIAVIGTDGRIKAENMGFKNLPGTDLNNRDYVHESLRTGQPFVSGPFRSIIPPHNPLIAIVTPVRDNRDRVICLLAGYHTLGDDQFLTSISPNGLGKTGYFGIVYGHTILMHSDKTRIMETIPEGKNRGIDEAAKGFEGTLDFKNSKGQRLLSSFKRIGETGWTLAANISYDEAFEPLRKLKLNAFIISSLCIIFSLMVLCYVTRRLTKPILQLISHVDQTRDDPSGWQPLELRTGDEIERLADTFNSMMNEVRDTKQRLNDENAFFSNIIQDNAAPMLVIDRDHRIIFWNSALSMLTGKSSLEMIGTKDQWTPFYPSRRPIIADLVLDHALDQAGEFYSTYSASHFLKDSLKAEGWYENIGGKRRYIYFEATPVRNSSNEIIAAVETIEDITDGKLAQEAAVFYSLFLREVMDAIPDPVFYKNTEGVYLGCNAAFRNFFGKTEEDIIGRTLLDIMTEKYSELSIQMDKSILDSLSSIRFETELMRGDGMVRSALVSKAPFSNPDGSIAGIVGVFVDITEQKVVEAELLKSRMELEANHLKMKYVQLQVFQQEKMASIGQLAAGVAHEINNPMGFITSNLITLKKYLERLVEYTNSADTAIESCGGNSEQLKELRKQLKIGYITTDSSQLIAESEEGAGRVRRIVQDLMSFSRVDKAESILANLNESLETTINIAWNEIRYITSVNREFGDIPEIQSFPQQLNQVFLNLLLNAAHAMEGREGSITVRTWREGEHVFVSVADSGCGIPDNIRQRVFEPFFTTKEVGRGTGLGLSISYDIVRKHGGEIRVESEIWKGTTFTVKLPINGPSQESTV